MKIKPLITEFASLSIEEIKRYSRHVLLPEIGLENQQRISNSKVLVIGAGGLGSPILLYLAASGVKELGICDFDIGEKVESVEEVADIYKFRKKNNFSQSVLIANPIAKEDEFDPQLEKEILDKGMKLAKEQHVSGKNVTPFLLGLMHSESKGKSLKANVALVKSNARLAAQIAVAISK